MMYIKKGILKLKNVILIVDSLRKKIQWKNFLWRKRKIVSDKNYFIKCAIKYFLLSGRKSLKGIITIDDWNNVKSLSIEDRKREKEDRDRWRQSGQF